jgi:FkbM family methyltransferase
MIFLDLGTNEFQGLEELTKPLGLGKDTTVYCFEPNTMVFKRSRSKYDKVAQNYKKVNHYNNAIMDYTGKITFNSHHGAWDMNGRYDVDYTGGSNCIELNPKRDGGSTFDIHQEEVDCVDINDLMNEVIFQHGQDCDIYIKCDIEGSEFKVLPRLLESPYIKNVKKIYIEWHERFYQNTNEYAEKCRLKEEILKKIQDNNIIYVEHH